MNKIKKRIWLAEDDKASRKMLVHYLSKKIGDYEIEEFEYAEELIEKIKETDITPDLLIFDNILKGKLTGIDATEQIKNEFEIPILVYSATPTTELLNRCINLKMTRYLSKPINPIELDFHIRALLKEHEVNNQLSSLNSKYFALFNKSKDMIYISDPKGKILDINPAGIKLLGYETKEELFKIDIQNDLYFDPEERTRFKNKMHINGYVQNFQTTLKKKDNTQIIVTISSSIILKDKNNLEGLYIGIIRDITKQIENEQNLIKMNVEQINNNEKLKKTQLFLIQQEKMASLGGLAAGIAHEINNPLGFVMSNFRTLKKYIDKMKDYLKFAENTFMGSISDIDNSVLKKEIKNKKKNIDFIIEDLDELFMESTNGFERISSIVENMQRFSRVDNENNRSFINLNDSIRNTLIIAKNSYKYVADIVTNLSEIPDISCNRSEINQVLLNIIVNAAQAIAEQKNKNKGVINISTYIEKEKVCCQIKDNGSGIPENNLSKVFDPFFTTKEVGKGTGMGLGISYDIIVNKHNGELLVESNKRVGTKFTIKLHINNENKAKQELL